MPTFRYEAFNESGAAVSGTIEAGNADEARQILVAKGLMPSKLAKGGKSADSSGKDSLKYKMAKVKIPDMILFTKQMRTMLAAGISIVRLLDILTEQCDNPKLKVAVQDIGKDIREGTSLYNAFRKHPKIFNDLYCSLLRAGETSGNLPEVLDRLIYIIEHDYKVRKKIQGAMIYPVVVVVLLFLAFIFLLTFVIPKFTVMFLNSGVELPLPTKICIILYDLLKAYWPYMLGSVIAAFVALIWYIRTPKGKLVKDRFMLRMPLFGPVIQKGAMSRFTSIFAILQSSGVTVLSAVEIISQSIGNTAISKEFDGLREKLEEGRGISGPLRGSRYFPPMVVNMINIGEESGNLDAMLSEVSNHYDYEVEHSINKMTEMIGPILICGLAGVVGFFALAIYLPLVDIIKTMK